MPIDFRRCEKCRAVNELIEFYRDRTMPLGRSYVCKVCALAAAKERQAAKPKKRPSDPAQRFWRYVAKSDGCWLWVGSKTAHGYGRMTVNKRVWLAHRYAWLLETGSIPRPDLDVCHRCDVPLCVRPSHLFLGTHSDNMADRESKGRGRVPSTQVGERHHQAKLTVFQARSIYVRVHDGESAKALAKEFGVDASVISDIKRRRAWRSATEPITV